MTSRPNFHGLWTALAATLVLSLAACSSGTEDGGGLLDNDGSSSSGTSGSTYTLTLDGPTCVEPGSTTSGFTATLKTRAGKAAADVYVKLEAELEGAVTNKFSIRSTKADGKVGLGGANTHADGVLPFAIVAPTDAITSRVSFEIVGVATSGTSEVSNEARQLVDLQPAVPPSISIQGPLVGSSRVGSGGLTVPAGTLAPDFVVQVKRGAGSCGGVEGSGLSGVPVTLTTTLPAASIRQINATTLIDGSARFDYVAPATVASNTADTITATARGGTAGYKLTVSPPPPPADVRVAIAGPTTLSPNQTQAGYTATVTTVDADGTVVAREGARLTLALSDGGTITQVPGALGVGVADKAGQIRFSVTPKASSAANTTIRLTATVDTTTDAAGATACTKTTSVCAKTLDLLIQPDSFKFTAPVYGASGITGTDNAVPLSFSWTNTSGTGVPGCVNLSTTFQGGGTAPYGLIINNDPVTLSQTRQAQLNSDGTLQVPLKVLSDRSGFVLVTATENRSCSGTSTTSGTLTASTGVQFVDNICTTSSDGRNCVDLSVPLRVQTSPDASGAQRTLALTFTVFNSAYQPIDGAQVLFDIAATAGAGATNERVFPGGGTTDASGVATTKYYVPTFTPALAINETRTIQLRACVRRAGAAADDTSGQVCSIRTVEVVGPTS